MQGKKVTQLDDQKEQNNGEEDNTQEKKVEAEPSEDKNGDKSGVIKS